MVKTSKTQCEAVRPNINVTFQKEEDAKSSLSHHGETASSSSTCKATTRVRTEPEQGEEHVQEDEDGDEEEAQEPKTRRAPKGPTKEEKEKHEATHLPFREWCQHCVRGRGRNKPHKKKTEDEKEENKVSRISMDYLFMSQDEEKASENPLILMVDEQTGNKYMRAISKKGLGEGNEMDWLIKDMHEELKS